MNNYEHYIALDWSQSSVAFARVTPKTHPDRVKIEEYLTSVKETKRRLERLGGRKILTFEESTVAQWLFVELKPFVDEVLVCDPMRNHLLKEGAKTDRLDARKLALLLRAGLLKPVYHSLDELIEVRKLTSGYEDVVKAGVRLKNQLSSYKRRVGERDYDEIDRFVLQGLWEGISRYEGERERYHEEFEKRARGCKEVGLLQSIPGIGLVNAMKIAAIVVDPRRFKSRNHFLSYCGLVRLSRMSGNRSYGSRTPRYSRELKEVFKCAAMSNIHPHMKTSLKAYYRQLLEDRGYPEYQARHALARRIAVLALGVLKTRRKFEPTEEVETKTLTLTV